MRYWIEEDHFNGMDLLKIVSRNADVNNMLQKLQEMIDVNEVMTFGYEKDKYNVFIPNNNFNHLIKCIHKEYKGIKNIKGKR